jgi:hypothetical protein
MLARRIMADSNTVNLSIVNKEDTWWGRKGITKKIEKKASVKASNENPKINMKALLNAIVSMIMIGAPATIMKGVKHKKSVPFILYELH